MQAEKSRVDCGDVLELCLADDQRDRAEGSEEVLTLRRTEEPRTRVRAPGVHTSSRDIRVEVGELPLEDGVWEVLYTDPEGGGDTPVGTRDCCFSLARNMEYLGQPRQRKLQALRSPDGALLLQVSTVAAYAEVGWVDSGTDTVTVSGRLAYTERPPGSVGAEIVARQRERSGTASAPAEIDSGQFHCEIPLKPLLEAHDPERKRNEWDLWLRFPGDERELRLATHADGVPAKKRKVLYPTVTPAGGNVRIRPYYTVDDTFSLLATEAKSP
ncbi:hypothetical protein FHX37_0296 [Haloactinospora alba]|uniref:Uncharacterized protein n=1 Tax=Haloactinospora alba TaxID=405555 RepID=A0A543NF02_9ACTN|nr:hypothetical protein [Haloactinospora alba]TQN30418.1 hypothetical protein FHX37_0296 [Haloactinospora alba]